MAEANETEKGKTAEGGVGQEKIAIVGGGIAGLFCALVLLRQGKDVELFETSKRLGGRIRTIRLDARNDELGKDAWSAENLNFYVEFGPMRLELDKQQLLKGLLEFLGIREGEPSGSQACLVPFPSVCSPDSDRDPHYDLAPAERDQSPLELMRLAFRRIVARLELAPAASGARGFPAKQAELLRRLELAEQAGESLDEVFCLWLKELDPQDHWDMQTRGTIDGVPLFKMGFWNLLTDYLSHDAITKLRDLGTFYHLLPENPNAAEWLVWWMVGLSASDRMQGIFGGMECIVDEIRKKIGAEERLHCECWVKKLEAAGGQVRLVFADPQKAGAVAEKTYDRVILALPRRALQEVQRQSGAEVFAAEPRIQDLLESSFGFPMTKTFIVLRERWWQENNMANRFATRMPTRELHYWKGHCQDDRQGLIMAYTDRPASAFWANYVPSGAQIDANSENLDSAPAKAAERPLRDPQKTLLLKKMAHYINENNEQGVSAEDIAWYGIRDWGRAPFSGANHAWRPERKYWVVMRRLGEIGERGQGAGVHVCGEAYSDYHGFIEGPLRSAAYVLHRILDRPTDRPDDDETRFMPWLAGQGADAIAIDGDYLSRLRQWAKSLDLTSKTEAFLE